MIKEKAAKGFLSLKGEAKDIRFFFRLFTCYISCLIAVILVAVGFYQLGKTKQRETEKLTVYVVSRTGLVN